MVKRFDVFLASLDPTVGSEIRKTRPVVVISPDEMNGIFKTVIVAPMTSTIRHYPTRVTSVFQGKEGQIALDQIRTIDKVRLIKLFGQLETPTAKKICSVMEGMFCY